MIKFFIFIMLLLFPFTNLFADYYDKIQGDFFCEITFPDNSTGKKILKVSNGKMKIKDFEFDFLTTDWIETYLTTNMEKAYSIYTMPTNSAQNVIILAKTSSENKIMYTGYDTERWYKKSQISHGICKRI